MAGQVRAVTPQAHRRQAWAARAALVAALAALSLPLVEGGLGGLMLLIAGFAGLAVTVAALWWTLSRRGAVRMAAATLALLTPVVVVTLFAQANLLWVVVLSGLLWSAAVWSGRYALRTTGLRSTRAKEYRTPPSRRPF
ncbi:diacylglycerol kinase, partial [Streptomyces pharetrae]